MWCRGKKKWESEILCLDCHSFTLRTYSDPDFKTPEEYEKERWQVRKETGWCMFQLQFACILHLARSHALCSVFLVPGYCPWRKGGCVGEAFIPASKPLSKVLL